MNKGLLALLVVLALIALTEGRCSSRSRHCSDRCGRGGCRRGGGSDSDSDSGSDSSSSESDSGEHHHRRCRTCHGRGRGRGSGSDSDSDSSSGSRERYDDDDDCGRSGRCSRPRSSSRKSSNQYKPYLDKVIAFMQKSD